MAIKWNLNRVQLSLYQPLFDLIDIAGLSKRKKITDVKFLFKLAYGFIKCPEILGSLNLNVLQFKASSTAIFYMFTHRTNYSLASPINRITSIVNDLQI